MCRTGRCRGREEAGLEGESGRENSGFALPLEVRDYGV